MGGAQATSTEALPFDVIDLTPTTVVAYRLPPSIDRPSTTPAPVGRRRASPSPPAMSLKVRIFEPYEGSIFPTIQRPAPISASSASAEDGTINVPYVGVVRVAGLDLGQIERRIASSSATRRRIRRSSSSSSPIGRTP